MTVIENCNVWQSTYQDHPRCVKHDKCFIRRTEVQHGCPAFEIQIVVPVQGQPGIIFIALALQASEVSQIPLQSFLAAILKPYCSHHHKSSLGGVDRPGHITSPRAWWERLCTNTVREIHPGRVRWLLQTGLRQVHGPLSPGPVINGVCDNVRKRSLLNDYLFP